MNKQALLGLIFFTTYQEQQPVQHFVIPKGPFCSLVTQGHHDLLCISVKICVYCVSGKQFVILQSIIVFLHRESVPLTLEESLCKDKFCPSIN